jgi:hypothetical protein
MKPNLLGAALVVAAFTTAIAGQSKGQKLSGHLVDAVCANNHATEAGYAANHDKQCNLMDVCIRSGFSLMTADHKVFKFDQKGDEQALALIKATDKDKDWKVSVTGNVDKQTIAVTSITLE